MSFESPVFYNRKRNETLDRTLQMMVNPPHAILYHSQTQKAIYFRERKTKFLSVIQILRLQVMEPIS